MQSLAEFTMDYIIKDIEEQESESQTYEVTRPENLIVSDNKQYKDLKDSDNEVIKLLQKNVDTIYMINYIGKSLPDDSSRNMLSALIANEIIKGNKTVTLPVYDKWCGEIKQLFPSERTTVYYTPTRTVNGVTHQAKGKLVCQVHNKRRKLQKRGVLMVKKRHPNQDTHASTSTSTREITMSVKDLDTDEELQWLKNSSGPWSVVEKKWKITRMQRIKYLIDTSVDSYFEEYPALKKPLGYKLLESDFEAAYAQHKDNLHLYFPASKPRLLQQLEKKVKKDAFNNEIIKLAYSQNEELQNIAAILSISQIITSNVIINVSSAKVKKTWRPTKIEARESFITHVEDDSYIRLVLEKRHIYALERGLTPQPYIVMVGPNLSNIKRYLVVINHNLFYDRSNILSAVDLCFKSIWALNLEYSADCYGLWLFIQKAFFKLNRPHDKNIISVESLMTDCNLS